MFRKIAIDDPKSINFTESEKKPCLAPNYTRLQKVEYLLNKSFDLNEISDFSV